MDQDKDKDIHLSERERMLLEAASEMMVKKMMETLKSDQAVDTVINHWTGVVDKRLGKAVRRISGTLLTIFLTIGAFKMGLIDRAIQAMSK